MIETENLTKKYGATTAVDDLTFTVRPGSVTGFLGPNGAGKSTTMRLLLGLDRPTSGQARIGGKAYREHRAPLREVGALLETRAVHRGRSARSHLRYLASTEGIPDQRVDEVLELVGLGSVARKRVGGFSLGMGQRLGIATALLGDPATIMLDEPVNGLDPDGVRWIRTLLRSLAAEGRTVLVSSHLMAEMAQTADRLVVLGRGRLVADTTVDELVSRTDGGVDVRSPQAPRLAQVLTGAGLTVQPGDGPDLLHVQGADPLRVGQLAAEHGVVVQELRAQESSLEEAYMALTKDSREYRSNATPDDTLPDPDAAQTGGTR